MPIHVTRKAVKKARKADKKIVRTRKRRIKKSKKVTIISRP